MNFKKYPSIESTEHKKEITYFKEYIYSYTIEQRENIPNFTPTFMVTEKIHGMNLQVTVDITDELINTFKNTVAPIDLSYLQLGTRTEYLNDDRAFWYIKRMVDTDAITAINLIIAKILHGEIALPVLNPKAITFYGEFFGGSYPIDGKNYTEKDCRRIQKGVYYSPNNRFMLFDIAIRTDTECVFLNGKQLEEIKNSNKEFFNDKFVPTLLTDVSIEEALNYPVDKQSIVSELLHLPVIENNNMEGVVIKGYNFEAFKGESRVIFKNKSTHFKEKAQSSNKQPKQVEPLSKEVLACINKMQQYNTEARVSNVCSHYDNLSLKDMSTIIAETMRDIISDYNKTYNDFMELEKAEQKKVTKAVTPYAVSIIKKYLFENY